MSALHLHSTHFVFVLAVLMALVAQNRAMKATRLVVRRTVRSPNGTTPASFNIFQLLRPDSEAGDPSSANMSQPDNETDDRADGFWGSISMPLSSRFWRLDYAFQQARAKHKLNCQLKLRNLQRSCNHNRKRYSCATTMMPLNASEVACNKTQSEDESSQSRSEGNQQQSQAEDSVTQSVACAVTSNERQCVCLQVDSSLEERGYVCFGELWLPGSMACRLLRGAHANCSGEPFTLPNGHFNVTSDEGALALDFKPSTPAMSTALQSKWLRLDIPHLLAVQMADNSSTIDVTLQVCFQESDVELKTPHKARLMRLHGMQADPMNLTYTPFLMAGITTYSEKFLALPPRAGKAS